MQRRRRRPDPLIGQEIEVAIEHVGSRGDGVAVTGDGPLYVAGAAPGDVVRVRRARRRGDGYAASVVAQTRTGPNWREAECAHFALCGGCAAQHLNSTAYVNWKQSLVEAALRRRNLTTETIRPLLRCMARERRRAQLHAHHRHGGIRLGFHGRDTHDVVDVKTCVVLRPSLVGVLPNLRDALHRVLAPGARADLLLTEATNGLDILITGEMLSNAKTVERLAAFAGENGVVRTSRRTQANEVTEPVVQFEQPFVDVGGVPVPLPAGAFLQPSKKAEREMAAFVLSHIGPAKRVIDLYAGLGAFSLPLVRDARRVHAVDINGDALSAVAAAAGRAGCGGLLTTECRDLAATPLQPKELAGFDAAIFDPPRAGATAQAQMLARTNIRRIVAISCEPSTFARDAERLTSAGYRLEVLLPVDQFVYSSKLEIAAAFSR